MFSENAATQRQVDEIDGRVNVIKEQIKSVKTQNLPIINEVEAINVQIEKVNDQIENSKIINPIKASSTVVLVCSNNKTLSLMSTFITSTGDGSIYFGILNFVIKI